MKIFKKLVVAATAATMIFGTVSSAFAAVNIGGSAFADVDADDKAAEAFNVLAALGVYQGNEGIGGNVRPDSTITREEFSAVVVRFLDKESTAKSLNTYVPSFTDANSISSWAWGYVNVASSLGIVNGYPNGEFRPQNPVTHAEAIAMLTRAVNVDKAATGVWPLNYVVLGGTVGITDDVDIVANVPATRAEVAIMTFNAYGVEHKWNSDDEKLDRDNDPFGTRELDVRVDAKVTSVTQSSITFGDAVPDKHGGKHNWAATAYVVGVSKITDLVDLNVNAYLNADDEVVAVVVDADDEELAEGKLDTKKLAQADPQFVVAGKRYRDFDNAKVFVNNVEIAKNIDTEAKLIDVLEDLGSEFDKDGAPPAPKRTLGQDNMLADTNVSLTLNKDGDITTVRVLLWDVDGVLLDGYDEDDDTIEAAGNDYKVTNSTLVTLNGKTASLADIQKAFDEFDEEYEEKPLVYIATEGGDNDENAYAVAVYTEVITGDVVAYGRSGGDDYVTIRVGSDEKDIKINAKLIDAQGLDDIDASSLVGNSVSLLLDMDGKAVQVVDRKGDEKDFYAVFVSYRSNEDGDVTRLTLKNGDKEDINYTVDKDLVTPAVLDNASNGYKRIVYVNRPGSKITSVVAAVKGAADDYEVDTPNAKQDEEIKEIKSNYIKTDKAGITALANNVIVWDTIKDEQISVSQLRKGWTINFGVDDDGAIGVIIVTSKN